MAHKRSKRRREEERTRKETKRLLALRKKRQKQAIAATIAVVLIVLIGWQAIENAPPRAWATECINPPFTQHIHWWLFIQIGETENPNGIQFVRIPENTGITTSCTFPVHTHGDRPEERELSGYVKIHVEATHDHRFTVGEFIHGWSVWADYSADIYLASDGISYYRGSNFQMIVNGVTTALYDFAPAEDDRVQLWLREPCTTVGGPYPGGPMPSDYANATVCLG